MIRSLTPIALLMAAPLHAANEEDFDPGSVSEIDAINCHLDVPTYNGFAMAVAGEEDIAGKRHWRKVETGNPFMTEYELAAPIAVAGDYSTRRIGFTSSGIVAILDLDDPELLAREEGIANSMDPDPIIEAITASGKASRAQAEAQIKFRKFLGERILVDVTEPAEEKESFGTHTVIARSISNATTHPGKTLYGCSYQIELLDKDGNPL